MWISLSAVSAQRGPEPSPAADGHSHAASRMKPLMVTTPKGSGPAGVTNPPRHGWPRDVVVVDAADVTDARGMTARRRGYGFSSPVGSPWPI